jgi:tetratricopeptide (TPR) repeat protein
MGSDDSGTLAIGRRYGAEAANDWRRVLSHFALNSGFALLVVIVPDRDGATLCRRALCASLRGMEHGLRDLSPDTPMALRRITSTLRDYRLTERDRAVWIEAATPASSRNHEVWQRAWRWGLATLNQNRNALRGLDRTVMIVGTPALVPLFREAAPDLWSIRDLVAHIEPDPTQETPATFVTRSLAIMRSLAPLALDRSTAEQAVTIARQGAARGAILATALIRAARARMVDGDSVGASEALTEAVALAMPLESSVPVVAALVLQAELALWANALEEAEAVASRAVTLVTNRIVPEWLTSRSHIILGLTLLAGGKPSRAEQVLRELLALIRSGGVGLVTSGVAILMLSQSLLGQGRMAEAQEQASRAIRLLRAGGVEARLLVAAIDLAAEMLLAQGCVAEAEALWRDALALAATQPEAVRAALSEALAQTARLQGRGAEARALARDVLALAAVSPS